MQNDEVCTLSHRTSSHLYGIGQLFLSGHLKQHAPSPPRAGRRSVTDLVLYHPEQVDQFAEGPMSVQGLCLRP